MVVFVDMVMVVLAFALRAESLLRTASSEGGLGSEVCWEWLKSINDRIKSLMSSSWFLFWVVAGADAGAIAGVEADGAVNGGGGGGRTGVVAFWACFWTLCLPGEAAAVGNAADLVAAAIFSFFTFLPAFVLRLSTMG